MDENKIETTLLVTEAMAGELPDYLMGDNLYRQLIVKTPQGTKQPKMTVGALLENLALLRWAKPALSSTQRQRLAEVESQASLARGAFATGWRELLLREWRALLGSWRWYLEDAGRNAGARENYASEVHIRTRLEVVAQELGGDAAAAAERRELAQLDQRLQAMLQVGGYVGPRDEQGHYAPQQAWWLYGKPQGSSS
jgi:hypothetical protein